MSLKNRNLISIMLMASAFGLGWIAHRYTTHPIAEDDFKRVTGIGGIFFKCKDPKAIREWYQQHLGLNTNPYGAVFEWRQGADSSQKGFTQWSPFAEKTKYFAPSSKEFMINYRVADLEALIEALRKEGVVICDTMEVYDYGKFVHIMDPEGNKIELWEPNDAVYDQMGKDMNMPTTK